MPHPPHPAVSAAVTPAAAAARGRYEGTFFNHRPKGEVRAARDAHAAHVAACAWHARSMRASARTSA